MFVMILLHSIVFRRNQRTRFEEKMRIFFLSDVNEENPSLYVTIEKHEISIFVDRYDIDLPVEKQPAGIVATKTNRFSFGTKE
jgi:hypothetical protein